MKKIYVMPRIENVYVKMESALAAGTTKPIDNTPAGDDDFDSKEGGFLWDDED